MRRFTVILLSISIAFASYAVEVCVPAGASFEQLQELNGIELAFSEAGLSFERSFNCTRVEIRSPGGIVVPDALLPTAEEELVQLLSLIRGHIVAVVYREDLAYLAKEVISRLEGEGFDIFVYAYPPNKKNYSDILKPLVLLKDKEGKKIDSVVFLGYYREAILILPFFRIFHPFPKVVATWRIYDPLIFAYKSFLETVFYYEWFPSWLPLVHVRGFVVRYIARYKTLPSRYAALGYDAANMVIKALESGEDPYKVKVLGVTGLVSRNFFLVYLKDLPFLPPPVAY